MENEQMEHFSHPHPLRLTNLHAHSCNGCRSPAEGRVYRCNRCDFDLHLTCSLIAPQIKHPADKHDLQLLARAPYPSGKFRCNACDRVGDGFTYHCTLCKTDIHPFTCANLPFQLNDPRHHHTMTLSFRAPYPQNRFRCNFCQHPGKRSWLYHCSRCSFDMHVTCVNTNPAANARGLMSRPSVLTADRPDNRAQVHPRRSTLGGVLRVVHAALMIGEVVSHVDDIDDIITSISDLFS